MADEVDDLGIVVYGATGYTGRLVCEHLAGRTDVPRWGIAGRDEARLREVSAGLGLPDLPVVVANAHDSAALGRLVRTASVVISTVGPYMVHGDMLVAACVEAGTDYVDVTGEVPFIRRCIDRHQERAEETGARIVNACGYDSAPSDLGVLEAQQAMRQRHGTAARQVSMRVLGGTEAYSGGTYATMLAAAEEAARDPVVAAAIADPHSLLPAGERSGPASSELASAAYDPRVEAWIAPFVMAPINTRVVRRSNALLGYPWGHEFRYDEAVVTGPGVQGRIKGSLRAFSGRVLQRALRSNRVRSFVAGRVTPPGSGPDEDSRAAGSIHHLVIAEHPEDPMTDVRVEVAITSDAYTATGWMAGESALVLASGECEVGGGVWTPVSALGGRLRDRLDDHGGMTFTVLT